MSFGNFRLEPKAEHIDAVVAALDGQEKLTPQAIAKISGLSLTKVKCALNRLEIDGKIDVVRQDVSPKVRVSLRANV
jgi:predicted transcriptional regulator